MNSRQDIVLLVLDTHRLDRFSCYGNPIETTPNLDIFASEATLFRHAMSSAQWTVPSHSSMFTGLYPSEHAMFHASSVLPASLTTLAERLNFGSYFTAAYCNNPLVGILNNGLRRGFHSFLNYGGLMTSKPNQANINRHLFDRYRQNFKRLLANVLTATQDAFARSDTLLDFSFTPWMVPLWQTALHFKGNTLKALDDASKLMIDRDGLPDDQPIFSFINLMGTHMPYNPPRRFVERFAPLVLQKKSARRYIRHFNSDVFGWLAPLTSDLDDENKAALDGMYNAEVACQDEQVGVFLDRLRQSGRLDRTVVIVCADHGEHLGEKQLVGHNISLYNELVHVPLLIRDPAGNLPRGAIFEQHVSLRRIFHTVLTAAGIANSSEEALSLAQHSNADSDHGLVFAEGITAQNALKLLQRRRPALVAEKALDQPRFAIWKDQYKLIQVGEDHLELYNFIDDNDERINLVEKLPEYTTSLQSLLRSFVDHNGSSIPEVIDDDYDNDPEIYLRLRDLGYIE